MNDEIKGYNPEEALKISEQPLAKAKGFVD